MWPGTKVVRSSAMFHGSEEVSSNVVHLVDVVVLKTVLALLVVFSNDCSSPRFHAAGKEGWIGGRYLRGNRSHPR